MVPPRVVRDRNRVGANAVMLFLGAGMLAMFYLLTLYMQVVRGYWAVHTGLAYLPFVVGVGVASGGLGRGCSARYPPGSSSRPGCCCALEGWPGTSPCWPAEPAPG